MQMRLAKFSGAPQSYLSFLLAQREERYLLNALVVLLHSLRSVLLNFSKMNWNFRERSLIRITQTW